MVYIGNNLKFNTLEISCGFSCSTEQWKLWFLLYLQEKNRLESKKKKKKTKLLNAQKFKLPVCNSITFLHKI